MMGIHAAFNRLLTYSPIHRTACLMGSTAHAVLQTCVRFQTLGSAQTFRSLCQYIARSTGSLAISPRFAPVGWKSSGGFSGKPEPYEYFHWITVTAQSQYARATSSAATRRVGSSCDFRKNSLGISA